MGIYNYKRRKSSEVRVGRTAIGGANPVRIQSMNTTVTTDTAASVTQAKRISDAGGELVRLTTQGVREAANMAEIKAGLLKSGCDVPLVADVHFNPKAAFEAALHCDKVRINPGNFADVGRTFVQLDYSDAEYAAELEKIDKAFTPFLDLCKKHSTAIRIGVNHGSLSDRIMSRYGNNAHGMVESAMEYLRICKREGFNDVVISIKASNTVLMTQTVRLLCEVMESEGMDYPLHLGVTEAGDGEDGRIKSAVGIGTLLAEGYGDTIRVSLSEDPEAEIPVAALLRDYISARGNHTAITEPSSERCLKSREKAMRLTNQKSADDVLAAGVDFAIDRGFVHVDASMNPATLSETGNAPVIITSKHINPVGEIASFIDRALELGAKNPFVLELDYADAGLDEVQVKAGADFGFLLINGYGSAISLKSSRLADADIRRLELALLQATRLRFSKPEYIACPGCGRTLFDLRDTLREVKEATADMTGLKIAVMGCVVNGPGEMADADFGYVGAGVGRVSLYKGKELVHKNIPREEALPLFLEMLRGGLG